MSHSSSISDRQTWAWFCGDGIPVSDPDNASYSSVFTTEGPDQPLEESACLINLVTFLLHIIFSLIAILSVVVIKCYNTSRTKSRFLIRYPGHMCRYILTFITLFIMSCSIAEGVLTDKTFSNTQPQLYLPACCACIAVVIAIVYYQYLESHQRPRMAWLLFAYWIVSLGVQSVRIALLEQMGLIGVDITRFWMDVLVLVAYALFVVIELQVWIGGVNSNSETLDLRLEKERVKYTEDYVNFLFSITFWWLNWLFKQGYKRPLEVDDLGSLPDTHKSKNLYRRFKEVFEDECEKANAKGTKPSVWKAFARTFKTEIIVAGIYRFIVDICALTGPLLLNGIVAYTMDNGDDEQTEPHYITMREFIANGFVLVWIMFVCNAIQYSFMQIHLYQCNVIGVHIRAALQTMVYDKSLRLSTYAMSGGSMTMGEITNHMSTDAMNMLFFCQRMHYLWSVPFKLLAVFALLYYQIGPTGLLGLATMAFITPLQLCVANVQTRMQDRVMRQADERLKQANEMLLGMKLLKLYGWEKMFCKAIEAVRLKEIWAILRNNICYEISILLCIVAPNCIMLSVFVAYPYISGNPLEPDTTFVTLSLINQLMEPLYFTPMVTALLVNAFVGVRRLQTFFLAPEIESHEDGIDLEDKVAGNNANKRMKHQRPRGSYFEKEMVDHEKAPLLNGPGAASRQRYDSMLSTTSDPDVTGRATPVPAGCAIEIQHGDFIWDPEDSAPILKDINLEIMKGELTMVVGAVGSGKSSLVSALLGEMTTLKGQIIYSDTDGTTVPNIAFSAQKAWLMNATLRENVLFGQLYNSARYRKVIDASGLKPDIDILPGGDMIEIGEKGINLSGGQKQRISVARAMYSNKKIILMDDPLSALDVNVGGQVFQEGIVGRMRKAKRTVVLVTHQLQYLQQADKIVVMKEGRIALQGTFDDIAREDPELYQSWKKEVIAASEAEATSASESDTAYEERKHLQKQISISGAWDKSSAKAEESLEVGQLIEQEELARGSVAGSVYFYYIKCMGYFWAFAFVASMVVMESLRVSQNFWLSDWSEAGLSNTTSIPDITDDYVYGYVGLFFAILVVAVLNVIATTISTIQAAKRLHLGMLRNITSAPMRFFDTTPVGRILNRFSSDTQIIDIKLLITIHAAAFFILAFVFSLVVNSIVTPIFLVEAVPVILIYIKLLMTLESALFFILNFVMSLLVNAIVIPIFILAMTPIIVISFSLAKYFIHTSRELQRLDSVTRSPIFAHFSETLGGLPTIRAYRDQKRFFARILHRIDTNNSAFLYLQACYGWLGVQLSMCGAIIVLVVGITTLVQALNGVLDSSLVGLALSYMLIVSIQLYNLIRFSADTEMQMNPVERVKFYTEVPTENYDGDDPGNKWPPRGEVRMERVSVRYADTLPAVLKDVTLYVKPGEKVGICGRTGSGKSSLTLAFFRVIQTFQGEIVIDGEDIARLPLTTLRQRLSIIPQDPVLFTGTIRSNLDPQDNKSDAELWDALHIAQLKNIVTSFDLGLDATVTEGGENFSVGQRQLFCLARAFLRNSRVLIMDEATASIDYYTEQVLQEVVSTAFQEKTVLTIAHRVSTIMNSDTIWVLSDGEVVECDTPDNLLANVDGIFYSMVQSNK